MVERARVCEGIKSPPTHNCWLIVRVSICSGRCAVVAGAIASTYGAEAPAARAHGPRPWGYV